jgi:hypothetical protein
MTQDNPGSTIGSQRGRAKPGALFGIAGALLFSSTACELLGPDIEDQIKDEISGSEDGRDDQGDAMDRGDTSNGVSPECEEASSPYIRLLSSPDSYEGDDFVSALAALYDRAVAVCGESMLPYPPPSASDDPQDKPDQGRDVCESAAEDYITVFSNLQGYEGDDILTTLDRLYARAMEACEGTEVGLPPPPAGPRPGDEANTNDCEKAVAAYIELLSQAGSAGSIPSYGKRLESLYDRAVETCPEDVEIPGLPAPGRAVTRSESGTP